MWKLFIVLSAFPEYLLSYTPYLQISLYPTILSYLISDFSCITTTCSNFISAKVLGAKLS